MTGTIDVLSSGYHEYRPWTEAEKAAFKATMEAIVRVEIAPLVVADLNARIEKGTQQYGEPLTSHNGRDALWDAYEEPLDLCLYLRQAIAERQQP